jgi:hypothetical protein
MVAGQGIDRKYHDFILSLQYFDGEAADTGFLPQRRGILGTTILPFVRLGG